MIFTEVVLIPVVRKVRKVNVIKLPCFGLNIFYLINSFVHVSSVKYNCVCIFTYAVVFDRA